MNIKIIIENDKEFEVNIDLPILKPEDFDLEGKKITFEDLDFQNKSKALTYELHRILSGQLGIEIIRYLIKE